MLTKGSSLLTFSKLILHFTLKYSYLPPPCLQTTSALYSSEEGERERMGTSPYRLSDGHGLRNLEENDPQPRQPT